MSSMKIIKKRISSVNSTKKIMKAMNLVAASKLQKVKPRLDGIRSLYDSITQAMDYVRTTIDPEQEILFTESREVKNIAYIILTGDRGLCGSFNNNVSKEAMDCIRSNKDKKEHIIAIGSRGADYFRRRNMNIILRTASASEATAYVDAEIIANKIVDMYKSKEIDEAYIIYTHFESILNHIPYMVRLLPIKPDSATSAASAWSASLTMLYEPDALTFIKHAVPMYLSASIYDAMLESTVCEQSARMTNMDSATRNATEIIDKLTLEFNRMRQSMITQEITEIVSGANAIN
jgi:F-type H+-transporting ATPase subunit gamma